MFRAKKIQYCNFGEDLTSMKSMKVNHTHYQGTRFSKFYIVAITMQVFEFACKIIRRNDNSSIINYV